MEQSKVAEIVTENMKTIYAYSLSRVSNKEDAKDLASDIITAILSSAVNLRDDNALYGFIWGIASNTYKKYLRNQKRYKTDPLSDKGYSVYETDFTDKINLNEDLNYLRRELSLLDSQYRNCITLYYIDGLSCSEVSQKLNISPEMVKYYLFKTRKILKEGIGMIREYGEKSYNPGIFRFKTIFAGEYNSEYLQLFSRKLAGNILISAYYAPVSIRELAIELGVATVYLEDEIELLEKYSLLTKVSDKKYQTNIIIFTEAYETELLSKIKPICTYELMKIIQKIKLSLPAIRKLNFHGNTYNDNRILWALTIATIFHGGWRFDEIKNEKVGDFPKIYPNSQGIIYGQDYDDINSHYNCLGFAGRYDGTSEYPYYTYANFQSLKESIVSDTKTTFQTLYNFSKNIIQDIDFIVLSKDVLKQITSMLESAIEDMCKLYITLAEIGTNILKSHVPNSVKSQVERIVYYNMKFSIMGYLGQVILDTGELLITDKQEKLGIYGVTE